MMKTKFTVLLAGRSKDAIGVLQSQLSSRDRLDVQVRHIENGHADPLFGLETVPELLVLHVNGLDGGELEAVLERPSSERPPMIVVSNSDDAAAMRVAMKAGARDFLSHGKVRDVLESVETICDELSNRPSAQGKLIAVVNAKGGAGATFLACNLAHLTVRAMEKPAALIGLDMQFPTLPSYFDMKPRNGLLQAIEMADELDSVALDAIMASHESGLKLLAARSEEFRLGMDSHAEQANRLFDLLLSNYEHVVVDMPRRIDELNAQVASRACRIALVVQQSLPHVQDATRLQQLYRDQLGIPADVITVVVNRFNKSAEIQPADFEKALPGTEVVTVPNQFKLVSESINLGVPMYEHARHSAVTRALVALQSKLFHTAQAGHRARGASGFSSLLRKSPIHQLFGGN